jgi:phosphate-selective porin OprO/OprP
MPAKPQRRPALSCLAAPLAALVATGAQAQTPLSASPSSAEVGARIEKLEVELKAIEGELAALKAAQGGAKTTAVPTPAAPGEPLGETAAAASPTSAATAPTPGAMAGDTALAAAKPAPDLSFAEGTPTSAATASVIGGHPVIQSSDGRFTANLLGTMQFDAADYFQAKPTGNPATDLRRGAAATDTAHAQDLSDGTDFRRARIGIGGRAFGDFEYDILYEFGGAGEEDAGHIQEVWFQYSGLKPFHARIGAFPPFIGLEDAGSTNGSPFLERPASADVARSLAGGDYREGGELIANTDRWFLSAAITGRLVGVVNSTASGVSQPYDSQLGYVGRAAFIPLKGKDYLIHLGVHGSYVAQPADTAGPDAAANAVRYPLELRERPELRVDGTRLIDTGAIDAQHAYTAGFEAAGVWRSLFLQGEYDRIGIERRNPAETPGLTDPAFSGWYVEASWFPTGEQRRYNFGNYAFDGPTIRHDFSLKEGGWGAFEMALRYSDIDLNYDAGAPGSAPAVDAVRGGDQSIFTTGLNWYLNPVVRFMFDYQWVSVDRLSPSASAFATPPGAQIGQRYQAIAVRSQLAF